MPGQLRGSAYQVWLPESFTRPEQLVTGSPAHDKVFCKIDTSNTVKAADERLSRGMVDAGNHWTNKVRAESFLIQCRAHKVRHGLRGYGSLLAQAVEVHFVTKEIGDSGDVGSKASEAEVDRAVGEYFGEGIGDCEGLHAQAQVAGDGDAVLADHGDAGTAVWVKALALLAVELAGRLTY